MAEPKTLEEAIQIIKKMQRCGVCKHRKKYCISDSRFFFYCEKQYAERFPASARNSEVEAYNSCWDWE